MVLFSPRAKAGNRDFAMGSRHSKNVIFLRETGSKSRSTEFSGLRMRDGKRNTTCTRILREQKPQWGRFQPGRKRNTTCTRTSRKENAQGDREKSGTAPEACPRIHFTLRGNAVRETLDFHRPAHVDTWRTWIEVLGRGTEAVISNPNDSRCRHGEV